MAAVSSLVLGPLEASGFSINRSGVQWLVPDNYNCRPNEVVGYCNISLEPAGGFRPTRTPFADERELQVAFAPRVAGRLRIDSQSSVGGYLDNLGVQPWRAESVIAYLEIADDPVVPAPTDVQPLRLLMLAGRRMTGLADVLSGLLPGWHSRARGWWCDDAAPPQTLLNLGICDALGPVRGDRSAFLELFEGTGAGHVVVVPNHPVAPCAPCLLEQLERTALEVQAIKADITQALLSGGVEATADDWMFVGALLGALDQSPLRATFDLLTPWGLRKSQRPSAVLLSLNAEGPSILRHKTLGYRLHVLRVYQQAAGPAVRAWLASAFEPVKRSIDTIRDDYRQLIDSVSKEGQVQFLILNRMSTSGREDISTYAPFDAPMGDTLANVASKELNLMLHDLSEERDISIIDVDAIAAEFGGGYNIPDGVHQSGAMQAEVRAEIVYAMTRPPL